MTRRTAARYGYPLGVALLVAAICLTGGFLLVVALPEMARVADGGPAATASPTPAPTATSPMALDPIGIPMSPDADCGACHLDTSGLVGTREIPDLAHPLEGWKDCTACHADDRLVDSAPGHSGLHRAECLVCHQVPSAEGTAPPRPHHIFTDAACVTCHGTEAPLPTDMAGRTTCWICHTGTEFKDLFGEPAGTALPLP
jgi:hypothetical protein